MLWRPRGVSSMSSVPGTSLRATVYPRRKWSSATVLRSNVASRHILERLGFKVSEFGVKEVPRYGGPSRVGDVHLLERHDWLANRPAQDMQSDANSTR